MTRLNRRQTMQALLAISVSGALAACERVNTDLDAQRARRGLDYAEDGQFFSVSEVAFLSAVADTIIPDTETPGAVAAGVPETLQDLVSTWGDDGIRRYWRDGLAALSGNLEAGSRKRFADLPKVEQEQVLAAYDTSVFNGGVENRFYRDLKATISTAYFKSEPGATQELNYDPVPGEWHGDVAFSEIGKAWAT